MPVALLLAELVKARAELAPEAGGTLHVVAPTELSPALVTQLREAKPAVLWLFGLLQQIRAAGGDLRIHDGRLQAKSLPSELAQKARSHARALRLLLQLSPTSSTPTHPETPQMPRSYRKDLTVNTVYRSTRPANGKSCPVYYRVDTILPDGLLTVVGFNPEAPSRKLIRRTVTMAALGVYRLEECPEADIPKELRASKRQPTPPVASAPATQPSTGRPVGSSALISSLSQVQVGEVYQPTSTKGHGPHVFYRVDEILGTRALVVTTYNPTSPQNRRLRRSSILTETFLGYAQEHLTGDRVPEMWRPAQSAPTPPAAKTSDAKPRSRPIPIGFSAPPEMRDAIAEVQAQEQAKADQAGVQITFTMGDAIRQLVRLGLTATTKKAAE